MLKRPGPNPYIIGNLDISDSKVKLVTRGAGYTLIHDSSAEKKKSKKDKK